jgi:glycosyltransferase involved in cell wall biosynthesis
MEGTRRTIVSPASCVMSENKGAPAANSVTLLLPVLDEIDGLKAILPQIDASHVDQIVIVDGGSTDGSIEFAKEHSIRVIHQKRSGLALGVYDALGELDTEFVIEFSPDGNCMTDQLPEVVAKLKEGHDLVVVSRYLPGVKSYDDTIITSIGNYLFTCMISWLGRGDVTDALTIYRGFRIELTKDPLFEKLLEGPVFEPLVSALALCRKNRIAEIPGDEPERIGGEKKMRVFYNGYCILRMIIRLHWMKCTRQL